MPIGPKSESCLMGLILLNVYSDSAVSGFFLSLATMMITCLGTVSHSAILSPASIIFLLKLLPDVVA